MKIKGKVRLGVIFLFGTILVISGLSLYYINKLSTEAQNIIKDNYLSVEYTRRILQLLERKPEAVQDSIAISLTLQETNVTELGEREETQLLRQAFEKWKLSPHDTTLLSELRKRSLTIHELNMQAIIRKNEIAQATSREASTYVVVMVSIFVLIGFTFMINFPGYIANPITQLTQSIKLIAEKNYEERLHFDSKDEFEELSKAFNQMAEQLDEYEHSNLAKIIFEKERIETIINRMKDPVIGLDENKKIVFVNDQALALLNLSSEKLIGFYAPDIAVQNDLLRTLIQNDEVVNGSGPRTIKIVVSGKENYFSKESTPIKYIPVGEKKERSIGQVIILKNITTFRERDLAKTNFIATISHELKTPIASIQMISKLLQDKRIGTMNNEQEQIVKTLSEETDRLFKITHELLDLSQVETGNLKLDIQKTNSQDVIDYAVESVKFIAERKHVTIELASIPINTFIQADKDKTTWVLINLLTNAIRYSMENDRILLKCFWDNTFVVFSVEDFGPGIEGRYLDKLFDKFYQVPGSPAGTGLGLAISKEFIEAQGGSIEVKSEVGKGSTFSFRLRAS